MQTFEMFQPSSLDEALGLLASHGSAARVYAGGQDLLYRFKRGLRTNPLYLVNIKHVAGLAGIDATPEGGLVIRTLTRLADLEQSPVVRDRAPLLHSAVSEIASPQIRSEATVGGNLFQDVWCWYLLEDYDCWLNGGRYCFAAVGDHRTYHSIMGGRHCIAAHPSDLAPALIALQATCTITGPRGTRTVAADELWTEFHQVDGRLQTHALQPAEIALQIAIPPPSAGLRGSFVKYRQRNSWDFALASVAVTVRVEDDRCTDARVVIGGVATHPLRATATEQRLLGARLTEATIADAAESVTAGARPLKLNGYKVRLIQGLCRKALRQIQAEAA